MYDVMGPRPACWLLRQAVHTPYTNICPPATSPQASDRCYIKRVLHHRLQHPLSVALQNYLLLPARSPTKSPQSLSSPTEGPQSHSVRS